MPASFSLVRTVPGTYLVDLFPYCPIECRMASPLLPEMDGIEKLKGGFIIGATSQPELLDPSLLRPGRFEWPIDLSLPNEAERLEIIKTHFQGNPPSPEIPWGWSGAQIEALCRQAALAWFRQGMKEGCSEVHPFLLGKTLFEKGQG
ncbi:MAG: AAA family ATPase [Thermodesulfobacteriota bacterium]